MSAGARMAAEMGQQPEVLQRLIGRADRVAQTVRALAPALLHGTTIVARGSSDHASVYGRYLLELASGRPVSLAAPSLHMLYGARVDYSGQLAIAVSQSGRTPEIVTTLRRLRAAGARGLAITNDGTSDLADAADAVLALEAGEELAVPATKTVTAQLLAFALLARGLGAQETAGAVAGGATAGDATAGGAAAGDAAAGDTAAAGGDGAVPFTDAQLAALPGAVRDVLGDPGPARAAAVRLAGDMRLVVTARGLLYGAALESALKLQETAAIAADAFSSADLRHGPIAIVGEGFPVLALSAAGPAHEDVAELVADLRQRGARVLTVSTDGDADLPLPSSGGEGLAPILAVVRAQQLARELALLRSRDPDAPAGLRKVTVT
ncbi:SIS domain-containing protein [Conexibacter sp. CPCC 206217]|uniref:SIS domain-containing protein n=1 Tax=Conexibacter sp. CPCC 206217 TaxID=3064574 RepID=UPI00271FF24F|nr:SIS domain-containing protein [Conexibacter sp. CPCC 206217]MDO8210355.1 SIS domain-containing protein [Conexibacter sp. CPCC 206217]